MTKTVHLPAASGLPLCGRVLSRNAQLTVRDWHTMQTTTSQPSASPLVTPTSQRPSKPCRHCLRAAGLLPAVRRKASSLRDEFEMDQDGEDE